MWFGAGLLTFFSLGALIPVHAQAASSSHSGPISAVELDLANIHKWDDSNGDTWDPAWAEDDVLYSLNCDGRGFGHPPRNLALNSLSGPDLTHLVGKTVNAMDAYGIAGQTGPDGATWKSTGMECIDGTLYTFVCRNTYGNKSKDPEMRQTSFNASLIKSTDKGLTWTRSAEENYAQPMWPGSRFGAPSFIHIGKNGQASAQDSTDLYSYAISNNGFWNNGDDFILGRVLRSKIGELKSSDWTYFTGGDGAKESAWSAELTHAQPILRQPQKLGWNSPCYIPALKTYVLISWYVTPKLTGWFTPKEIKYDFYQAPHPWGPWTFINSTSDAFLDNAHMYGPNICTRYQDKVGQDVRVIMFTSGCPFQGSPDGLYKCWEIPLLLRTAPLAPVREIAPADPQILYKGEWLTHRIFAPATELSLPYTQTAGDSATINFTGTGIDFLADKFADQGSAQVYLDNQLRDTVSLKMLNFPRIHRATVFSVRDLAPGPHSLKIVNAGSDFINIAGFRVYKP